MDINSLRSFVLFSKYGTLSEVANAQYRTNSAISAQMKKLSDIYGLELFKKQGRNLILTESGKEFLDIARCILNFHDKLVEDIKDNKDIFIIKIGIPSDYVDNYLLKLIKYLSGSFSKIKFDLVINKSSELFQLWTDNKIDIAICSTKHNNIGGYCIDEVQGYWFGSKNYSVSEIGHFEVALFEESCIFHQKAIQGLKEKGTSFNIHSISSDSNTICKLVENFNIITAMSNLSKTSNMQAIEHPMLPRLPKIPIELLISKKVEAISADKLLKVLASPHK